MSKPIPVRVDVEYDDRFERQIEAGKPFADTGIRMRVDANPRLKNHAQIEELHDSVAKSRKVLDDNP